ncbi:MAG: hypothetical protein AAF681_14950 [Pseudomonadota bacterium]
MPRIVQIIFWSLFASASLIHVWNGDVVINRKIEGGEHFLLLRGKPQGDQAWITVSSAAYWAKRIIEYLMLLLASAIVIWAGLRWVYRRESED